MRFILCDWTKQQWYAKTRQSILRRLDRSLPFRILLSFVVAYLVLFTVDQMSQRFPRRQVCYSISSCLMEFASLITVDNVESFGILVVATLYVIESRDRRKRRQYEAWQVIDNAAAAGVPTSYALIETHFKRADDFRGANLEGTIMPDGTYAQQKNDHESLEETAFAC